MRRAPRRPRAGHSPGDEAVKRINRASSTEVTTRVTQVVMNASRIKGQRLSNNDVRLKSEAVNVSPVRMKPLANQTITAMGTALSQKKTNCCITMLTVSSNQIGYAYWHVFAVRFNSMQRPVRRAGAPSQISCEPTLSRIGVNGVIQEPWPTVTLLATAARIPILQPL